MLSDLIIRSSVIYTNEDIIDSISALAAELNNYYRGQEVVLLPVMTGVIPFVGQLLPQLDFSLVISYIHVSRYQNNLGQDEINEIYFPEKEYVFNKNLLVLDDIHDEGKTLHFIQEKLKSWGAKEIKSAVLFNKEIKNKVTKADFKCLDVPDYYVYGFGLDFNGIGRNMPHLYAYDKKDFSESR
jgi:hypoxanthine phosphoribosyltransferase